jgi:sugar O-acyltransferase (sialic acid O-acetyltransferase NeuD family)
MSTSESPQRALEWLLYACRTPYADEVIEIVWRTGGSAAVFVDNLPDPPASRLGAVLGPADLTDAQKRLPVLIPLVTPGHRHEVEAEACALGLTRFPVLVDPSAIVARTADIGKGSIVNAQSMIGAHAGLGRFVHVNRSTSIGHDARIEDYVSMGPGCVLAGHVTLETGCFVGAGAILGPNVRVGANAIVGVGAVVLQNVPPGVTVIGNPARIVRTQGTGYGGAAVPVSARKIVSL